EANRSSTVTIDWAIARLKPIGYPRAVMPKIDLPEPGRPYVLIVPSEREKIADVDRQLIVERFQRHGALLLRGFGSDVPQFTKFAQGFCSTDVVNSSLGRAPIDPEHNIHSVDRGVSAFALHSELSREPWRPDAAFFAWLSAPARGGETTICDGVELAAQMPEEIRRGLIGRRLLHLKPTWPEL